MMLGGIGRTLAIATAVMFVLAVAVGRGGVREHGFKASITTSATPTSVFGAILDPAAPQFNSTELGPLVDITWSKAPEKYAKVVERYQHGAQTYWVIDWEPGRRIEEHYVLDGRTAEILADLRQRWTIESTPSGTVFSVEQILYPRDIGSAFAIQMDEWFGAGDDRPEQRRLLQTIADYAVAHPRTSTAAIVASVHVGPLPVVQTGTTATAVPSSGAGAPGG
jgi:hypothetical protein